VLKNIANKSHNKRMQTDVAFGHAADARRYEALASRM